jgi:Leucine-rich repeat (LRR) protein
MMSGSSFFGVSNSRLSVLPRLDALARAVDLSENFLTDAQLPSLSLAGESLEWLDLSGNALQLSSNGFPRLPRLRALSLASNDLAAVPAVAVFAPALLVLVLDGNRLAGTSSGAELSSTSLAALSLRHNGLASLESFARASLPCLLLLDLDGNRLTTLAALEGLPGLISLSARANRIRLAPAASPSSTGEGAAAVPSARLPLGPLLETLRIDCNPLGLDDITPILRTCRRLQRLYASFTGLHAVALAGVPSEAASRLRVLDLSGCRIGDAGLAGLEGLRSLVALRLRSNEISSSDALISVVNVQTMPALVELDVRNNPLTRGFYTSDQSGITDNNASAVARALSTSRLGATIDRLNSASHVDQSPLFHMATAHDVLALPPAAGDETLVREGLPHVLRGCGPESDVTVAAAAASLRLSSDLDSAEDATASEICIVERIAHRYVRFRLLFVPFARELVLTPNPLQRSFISSQTCRTARYFKPE